MAKGEESCKRLTTQTLTPKETGLLKTWGNFSKTALHITCTDQDTKYCLGQMIQKKFSRLDRKKDPKGQQLVVLIEQTSWMKMGSYGHGPNLNFTRVTFKVLEKPKELEVVGPPKKPQHSLAECEQK